MDRKIIIAISLLLIGIVLGFIIFSFINNPVIKGESTIINQILLKSKSSGGLCPNGLCGSEIVIFSNGEYLLINYGSENKSGSLKNEDLLELKSLIGNANFGEIKSKPFTDTCPIAYDGVENVYDFPTVNESNISDCTYELDYESGLFFKLNEVRAFVYRYYYKNP